MRYDISAVDAFNIPGAFKYITLRTPRPKGKDLAPGEVTSDGAKLSFTYGWNAISVPVQNSRCMSTLFVTKVPGFYAAYSWDTAAQAWVAADPSLPRNPAKGYFIWL